MKRRNGKRREVLLAAYNKGFRVSASGDLVTPDGKPRCIQLINGGYPSFNYTYEKVRFHIQLHRLQGYQKFNWVIFIKGLLVRHRNNNKLDPSYDNLIMGTDLQNYYDNSEETRDKMRSNLHNQPVASDADIQASIDEIGF